MIQTYRITGMTCSSCQAKVQKLLSDIEGVKSVIIDLANGTAEIGMKTHIQTDKLQLALKDHPRYQLSEVSLPQNTLGLTNEGNEQGPNSWFTIYKPILVIFFYLTTLSVGVGLSQHHFDIMFVMRIFMGGFFLTFSFFKMLDLRNFADSYAMYDVVAKYFRQWGVIYAFIEFGLGFAYILNFQPLITNVITAIVMSVSLVGVVKSVLDKKKIRCACLGAVFNLPMSTVTIVEDALMILMSGGMLLFIF
jgi:copper chaperone CopZ